MVGWQLSRDSAKKLFFDRGAVLSAFDKATRRVLSRFGAFVRTKARTSIRSRRRVSDIGSPPSSHTALLKRNIFFSADLDRRSVVIGPTLINTPSDAGSSGKTVPQLLEEGGVVVRTIKSRHNRTTRRAMRYTARPYMGPAYEAELPNVPKMWADSLKPR